MLLIMPKSIAGEERKYGSKHLGKAEEEQAEQAEDSFSSCVPAWCLA